MKVVRIPDVVRGCGRRKKKACYLDAEFSPEGAIAPLTWALDTCLWERRNLVLDLAPRGVFFLDLAATLALRDYRPLGAEAELPAEFCHLEKVGRVALVDHVGEAYYTPWAFAEELAQLGPSRRVPKGVAKAVARHLPLPILFVAKLPLISQDDSWLRAAKAAGYSDLIRATWEDPLWGFRARLYDGGELLPRYDGSDHYMVYVLEAHHLMEPRERRERFPRQAELPFALSVITRAVYVLGDDEEDLPPDLEGSGILPARLVEPRGQPMADGDYPDAGAGPLRMS